MKTELADVNVLVALVVRSHSRHQDAVQWLRGRPRFATTPLTEVGLVRLLLNPRVAANLTIAQAVEVLRRVKSLPGAQFWPDATSLADQRAVLSHVRGSAQVPDTHLLNLVIANDGVLVTMDTGIAASLPVKHRHYVRTLG
jgi:toxin-antitoxin system PIN domain toxin